MKPQTSFLPLANVNFREFNVNFREFSLEQRIIYGNSR